MGDLYHAVLRPLEVEAALRLYPKELDRHILLCSEPAAGYERIPPGRANEQFLEEPLYRHLTKEALELLVHYLPMGRTPRIREIEPKTGMLIGRHKVGVWKLIGQVIERLSEWPACINILVVLNNVAPPIAIRNKAVSVLDAVITITDVVRN